MGNHSKKGEHTTNRKSEQDIKVVDVQYSNRRRGSQKKDIMDMVKLFLEKHTKAVMAAVVVIVVIVLLALASDKGKDGDGKADTSRQTEPVEIESTTEEASQETTVEETTPEETEPVLTLTPEAQDSAIATLISNFYQAYTISGDMEQVGQYIDSTTGMDSNRLTINKKYVEQVSDFACYPIELESVSEDYTIIIVTYKLKLYNYEELMPSIDILFLVNGESGYKVHNLTVDDTFDKQKIENDSNFQILSKQVATELTALLQANADLNEVYNLYLNPNSATQAQ